MMQNPFLFSTFHIIYISLWNIPRTTLNMQA